MKFYAKAKRLREKFAPCENNLLYGTASIPMLLQGYTTYVQYIPQGCSSLVFFYIDDNYAGFHSDIHINL